MIPDNDSLEIKNIAEIGSLRMILLG